MRCGTENIIMKTTVLCFCFVLVSVKASKLHEDEPQRFSVSKNLPKLEEGVRMIQHEAAKHFVSLIKMQTLDTQDLLSSFPKECSSKNFNSVQAGKRNVLKNFLKCNYRAIGKNVVLLYSDSTEYYTNIQANITHLESEILQCVDDSNPISCFVKAVSDIEQTFTNMISLVEEYYDEASTLVPAIITGIKSCLSKSSSDYLRFLASLREHNKLCVKNNS